MDKYLLSLSADYSSVSYYSKTTTVDNSLNPQTSLDEARFITLFRNSVMHHTIKIRILGQILS